MTGDQMLIAISILAHNESTTIGKIISDIGRQSLLRRRDLSFEIYVVANGCSDDTAGVAKRSFDCSPFSDPRIKTNVYDLERAGKSFAWNKFVHNLASPNIDFVFMLDADIRVPQDDAMEKMLQAITGAPQAVVAVDRSEKDLVSQRPVTIVEQLILAGTGTAYNAKTSIAGGFYCAKYEALRSIVMPVGLPGEDGFLRAMLLTNSFSFREDLKRLVFVGDVKHIFESEKTINGVFRHNIRLAIGTAINALLFEHISELVSNEPGIKVDRYISDRNDRDPEWINELIQERRKSGTYFILNKNFLLKRIHRLRSLSFKEKLKSLPILVFGVGFDVALFFKANALIRKGAGAGYW
jgi:glycosyltransferase involved in cell wall biosynthesis